MTTKDIKGDHKNTTLIYLKNQSLPEQGKKFTDPFFPPIKNSLLGLNSVGNPIYPIAYNDIPKNINSENIIFERASEIFKGKRYKIFSGFVEIDNYKYF